MQGQGQGQGQECTHLIDNRCHEYIAEMTVSRTTISFMMTVQLTDE
jgi:hypothetical protein